ncbi:MAG: flagellar biosynthetic protein FliO [Deltaproteobacteria bacterium]|nr:flagellar biosynthetic protein FliO [Deltaproteobacteria bacterium]
MEYSLIVSFVKMLFALAVVLGLMIASAYLLKRIISHTPAGIDNGNAINILMTRYLGPKHSIMMIEVLGQMLVVGVSSGQMTLLTQINDPVLIERMYNLQKSQSLGMPSAQAMQEYPLRVKNWVEKVRNRWGR